jgi:hypothetical protein
MKISGSRSLLWSGLLVATLLASTGCQLAYFAMLGQEHTVDPHKPLVHGRKDTKKVVVLAYARNELRFTYDALDDDFAKLLGAAITMGEVRKWRNDHPDWMEKQLRDIGDHFDADYVLVAEFHSFSINDSADQFLLQGRTSILFRIFDVAANDTMYDTTYSREYPPNRHVPLTDVASEKAFRDRFLATAAREISWYVVPHRRRDELSDI